MAALSRPFTQGWHGVQSNNEVIFDMLFSAHWERVYRLLVRVVGDPQESEAIALDVFWQLYRQPPNVDTDDQLAGWLYRVALNRGYNALRAAKRREKYEAEAGGALLVAKQDAPDITVERWMEQAKVRAALAEMKPRSAEVLSLRYSGLAYKEIAEVLEIAPGSIGTLLARAEKEFEAQYLTLYKTAPHGKAT